MGMIKSGIHMCSIADIWFERQTSTFPFQHAWTLCPLFVFRLLTAWATARSIHVMMGGCMKWWAPYCSSRLPRRSSCDMKSIILYQTSPWARGLSSGNPWAMYRVTTLAGRAAYPTMTRARARCTSKAMRSATLITASTCIRDLRVSCRR